MKGEATKVLRFGGEKRRNGDSHGKTRFGDTRAVSH